MTELLLTLKLMEVYSKQVAHRSSYIRKQILLDSFCIYSTASWIEMMKREKLLKNLQNPNPGSQFFNYFLSCSIFAVKLEWCVRKAQMTPFRFHRISKILGIL